MENSAEREGRERALRHFDRYLPVDMGGDIYLTRIDGEAYSNVPRIIVRHSPTGFEWGYSGSGPADLALNILAMFIGLERAQQGGLYQLLKCQFISNMPVEGGVIHKTDILDWLHTYGIKSDR